MDYKGSFIGTKLMQEHGSIGGAKAVFVKLRGEKNDLVFPTFGGQLKNPFKTAGRIFAGDLIEYRTDANGLNPVLYLLKTFVAAEAAGAEATSITVVGDGYHHVPCVGDVLMLAPSSLTGKGTAVTVTGVAKGDKVYVLTLSAAVGTVKEGDILVEAVGAGSSKQMLVQNPNAFAPCDYDLFDAPATGDEDFDGARYFMAPALHGIAYINRMSPVPACVLAANKSKVNGWFEL